MEDVMEPSDYSPVESIEECSMGGNMRDGLRQFRFEYGGHAHECKYEGRLILPDSTCAEYIANLITEMLDKSWWDI
jgi:hypothetical protein